MYMSTLRFWRFFYGGRGVFFAHILSGPGYPVLLLCGLVDYLWWTLGPGVEAAHGGGMGIACPAMFAWTDTRNRKRHNFADMSDIFPAFKKLLPLAAELKNIGCLLSVSPS